MRVGVRERQREASSDKSVELLWDPRIVRCLTRSRKWIGETPSDHTEAFVEVTTTEIEVVAHARTPMRQRLWFSVSQQDAIVEHRPTTPTWQCR